MDPLSTARLGMMFATRQLQQAADKVAQMGLEKGEDFDVSQEMVRMIEAKTAFKANVSVVKFADEMWDSLLKLQKD